MGDQPVRGSALMGLSDATPATLRLLRLSWESIPVERRRSIVHRLVAIAEDNVEADFRAVLRSLLKDGDPEVRATALDGLWEDESSSLADELVELLRSDPSFHVRAAAAAALEPFVLRSVLGELKGDRPAIIRGALLAALNRADEDLEVRCSALKAVAYWEDEEVRRRIAEAYADPDPHMRASAVCAMGSNLDTVWRKGILLELSSPEPELRFEAARAAGAMGLTEAVSDLIELSQEADVDIRLAAIEALGEIGGPAAKRALMRLRQSESDATREAAENALDELLFLEDPLAVPPGGIAAEPRGKAKKGLRTDNEKSGRHVAGVP